VQREQYIVHFPDTARSGPRLGLRRQRAARKKCFALRIASSWRARRAGLAEHHADRQVTSRRAPSSTCRCVPVGLRQDNLAMMVADSRWKVETIGDDIVLDEVPRRGRLLPINPSRFFGVAPGTSTRTNQNAMAMTRYNTIFTQLRAHRHRRRLVEGLSTEPPLHLIDWRGNDWHPAPRPRPRIQTARFTVPGVQDPAIARMEDPAGVPIDSFLFGGRRSSVVPAVYEAFDWEHGVFLGNDGVRDDRRCDGGVGKLRRDPFRCCLSAATWRLLRLWLRSATSTTLRSCRGSSPSTGSQGPSGRWLCRDTARTAAFWSGSFRARGSAGGRRRADWPPARAWPLNVARLKDHAGGGRGAAARGSSAWAGAPLRASISRRSAITCRPC